VKWNPTILGSGGHDQTNINTAIHEIMFVLAFSKHYLDEYFPTKENALGKSVIMVVTPEVIKNYVSTIWVQHLELEDQGGEGKALSH